MVGMFVGEDDGVEVRDVEVTLEVGHGARAGVEPHAGPRRRASDEVPAAGRARTGIAPAGAEDCQAEA